jgi:hypothetical protein
MARARVVALTVVAKVGLSACTHTRVCADVSQQRPMLRVGGNDVLLLDEYDTDVATCARGATRAAQWRLSGTDSNADADVRRRHYYAGAPSFPLARRLLSLVADALVGARACVDAADYLSSQVCAYRYTVHRMTHCAAGKTKRRAGDAVRLQRAHRSHRDAAQVRQGTACWRCGASWRSADSGCHVVTCTCITHVEPASVDRAPPTTRRGERASHAVRHAVGLR